MNLVTPGEAAWLRRYCAEAESGSAAGALAQNVSPRLFLPIVFATRGDRRAKCRACGAKLEPGDEAISFGFDPLVEEVDGPWGHLATAYLHKEGCDGGA